MTLWYRQTSCFVYGNSGIDMDFLNKKGKDCPIGLLVLKRGPMVVWFNLLYQPDKAPKTEADAKVEEKA
jgi:hypothetical protein